MLITQATAPANEHLSADTIRQALEQGLSGRFRDAKLLVLIPDHTRTALLPQLFRYLVQTLDEAKQLDFMVALGTHPPLDEGKLCRLVGISVAERQTIFRHVALLNHSWYEVDVLQQIGTISQAQVQAIAGNHWHPSLGGDVPVNINRAALAYDHILILGPTFPHEVAGFSGGAKYLFPGISGPEMIHVTHWLGALVGVMATIGVKDTAVRRMIHTATAFVSTPITLVALVVAGKGLAGMFVGDHIDAWQAAADLSAERHILRYDRPFQHVLSFAPPMYDELWTAAKAMYKLEPVVADGGELILFAPHLDTVSHVHGRHIHAVGYHVLDYFLEQWDRFKHIPLGVLAHSTHLRGAGRYIDGVEHPRIDVTLSSQISSGDCARLNLGFLPPETVNLPEWQNRESEGILLVPHAGEVLYRLKEDSH
jgi:lactate racemase